MDVHPILNGHPRILPPSHPTMMEAPSTEVKVETARTPLARPPLLEPEGIPPPRRKLLLESVDLSVVGAAELVSHLAIRDLKGPSGVFTPNLSFTQKLLGVVYKPPGSYESQYQLLATPLNKSQLLARLTKIIAFVPVFAWTTSEVVLLPLPMTIHGDRVLADLAKLTGQYKIHFKAFKQWDRKHFRPVVSRVSLGDGDVEIIDRTQWPTPEEILEVLQEFAFDDLHALAAANDDVRTILASVEVV